MILIAVSVDPVTFGFFLPGKRSSGDSVDQLVRRITLAVEAAKVDSEPRSSVARVAEVGPFVRRIAMPGKKNWRGEQEHEAVELRYAAVDPDDGLSHAEAIEAVINTVAHRSPDAGLVTSAQRELDAVTDALAGLGIVFSSPPVVIEGEVA